MDFELTKTQKEIQKAVRDFAKGEFDKELALELERKHEFPRKIWKKAGKLGLIGVHFPEEYCGQGLGSLEDILVVEAPGAFIDRPAKNAYRNLRPGVRLGPLGPVHQPEQAS